ncbi:hypothetical protein [Candidatus Carsonella ruddii]|uniref:hypothetical protein n=1 Tax=Carsonella ruddii TaxID=114186 RepID=UPI003D3FDA56
MKLLSKCLLLNNYLVYNFTKYNFFFIILNFNFKYFVFKKKIFFKKKMIFLSKINFKKKINLYGIY